MKWPGCCRGLLQSFGNGLVVQAVLSAGNFLAGWLLIRHTADEQYGYYVLAFNTVLLLTTLQGSFFQAQMVVRMIRSDRAGRADLVGGLMRDQRTVLRGALLGVVFIVAVLCVARLLDIAYALLIVSIALAGAATLMREYLRMVLFAYRRPQYVLGADVLYVGLLLTGVALATSSSAAAMFATLAMTAAAAASTMWLARSVWKTQPWNPEGAPGILRAFAPLGTWSVSGAAAHWALSQGYTFVVAGALSVQSVAAIAATRLPLMPLNLISAGLALQLFPIAADWVHSLGVRAALQRLAVVSIVLVAFACGYFAVIWMLRDWIFVDLLHKEFPQRDALLLLWCGAFVLMLVRDQLVKLLAARERFPSLAFITVGSAMLSLGGGYVAMLRFGETGAVAGILVGELANIAGIVVLTLRELRRGSPAPA
jgi:O-antigen/teichoic acid export membrane protein